ncbi:MAG: hypothetical protein ACO23V_10495 [Chitinophagaceae bacterium]
MQDKSQLIIAALQQRIGELVTGYESQVAFLRAEITQLIQEKEDKREAVQEYEQHLNDIISN